MSKVDFSDFAGRWVTVNGRHIFIKDGETPDEAFDRTFFGKKKPTESNSGKGKKVIYSDKDKDTLTGTPLVPGKYWVRKDDTLPSGTHWNMRKPAEEKEKPRKDPFETGDKEMTAARRKLATLKRVKNMYYNKHDKLIHDHFVTMDGETVPRSSNPAVAAKVADLWEKYKQKREEIWKFEDECKKKFGDKWIWD